MPGLTDTWTTPHEQHGGLLGLFLLFWTFEEGVTSYFNYVGFGCNAVYT